MRSSVNRCWSHLAVEIRETRLVAMFLTTTPHILEAISILPQTSDVRTKTALPTEVNAPISHEALVTISKCLPDYTLNSLLRGTRVYSRPPAPKPKPSPEYVALMARLRVEQEQRDYKALLARQAYEERRALLGQDPDEEKDDISPSLVLNILLSVVMCAGAAFYMTRWWPNDGVRVLVSLTTGIVVGVAEVTVYAGYLRKVDESRRKEKKLREKKEVIGEYTGPEDAVDATGVKKDGSSEGEQTEIWGRGVNGGMRRRVREKWEKEQDLHEAGSK